VSLLSRYATRIVLVFDADAAGRAAVERALEMFLAQQIHVRVATVPAGKDPCDYCLAEGAEGLRRLIEAAPDALEYVWRRRREALTAAGDNLTERRRVVEDFLNLVVSSAAYGAIDEVRRGQLAQHIAHLLNIPAVDLQQQMRRMARRIARGSHRPQGPASNGRYQAGGAVAERHLLEVLLNRPDLFDQAAERLDPKDFTDEQYHKIARRVWAAGGANLDELLAEEETTSLGGLLTDLAAEGERRGNYEQTLAGAVQDILYRRQRRELDDLRASPTSDEALRELSQRLRQPDVRRHPKVR